MACRWANRIIWGNWIRWQWGEGQFTCLPHKSEAALPATRRACYICHRADQTRQAASGFASLLETLCAVRSDQSEIPGANLNPRDQVWALVGLRIGIQHAKYACADNRGSHVPPRTPSHAHNGSMGTAPKQPHAYVHAPCIRPMVHGSVWAAVKIGCASWRRSRLQKSGRGCFRSGFKLAYAECGSLEGQ